MSSLGSFMTRWFGAPGAAAGDGAQGPRAANAHTHPTYPPVDAGLQAVSVEEVIAPHADILTRLRDAYGAEPQTFDRDIGSVVERYAQFVHLLPATADGYFRGAGGLFRMGLEVAFFALQATDGAIFSGRQTITQRSALQPRWRYATFLAGLCAGVHCAFTHFVVTNERGREWPAYLLPLATWLREQKTKRYYVRWRARPAETQALGILAMTHIVSARTLQHLAEGNAIIVPSLIASVSAAVSREPSMLDQLVRRALGLVIERELHASADRYRQPQLGSHLERYLMDAMRRLVAQQKWGANRRGSPLWYAQDGMFLLWPQAASDIVQLLEQDQVPGIPKAHQTIAEALAAADVIETSPDGSWLCDIFVADAATGSSAVKLTSPSLLAGAASAAAVPLPRALLKPTAANEPTRTSPQAELDWSSTERSLVSSNAAPASPDVPSPSHAPITLNAPARLNPAVRDALQHIIATIDSHSQPLAAFVIELGVFIPLKEFEQRSVDPALAVRALTEAGMLASDPNCPGSMTQSRKFHHEPVLGLVVAPHYVAGLDAASCEPSGRPRVVTNP